MRWVGFIAVALSLSACAGDSLDEGQAPVCAGNVYDACATEHGCQNLNCRFVGETQLCTQSCNDATPCPDLDGDPVECNMTSMLCEPAAPRMCRLPQ